MYTLLLSLVVGAVSAVPTPVGLQTDLSILLHNDLYGAWAALITAFRDH